MKLIEDDRWTNRNVGRAIKQAEAEHDCEKCPAKGVCNQFKCKTCAGKVAEYLASTLLEDLALEQHEQM